MQELGSFEFVYVKSLMKSQSYETSMILTDGATCMIKVQEIDNTIPIFVFNSTNLLL